MTKKKTAKEKKEVPVVKESIHAKHVFSPEELLDLSRQLGRTCSEINGLEQQKSAVGKDFGSRIETKEIARDYLIDRVTSGYEMRPTDFIVVFDVPNQSKDYFKIEPDGKKGEFVERREMRQADFQLALPVADKVVALPNPVIRDGLPAEAPKDATPAPAVDGTGPVALETNSEPKQP